MIHEDEVDKLRAEEEFNITKGAEIAKNNGINLTKFKQEINKGLTTVNDEDQWTYDYESYLLVLYRCETFISPIEWGSEFYPGRWSL